MPMFEGESIPCVSIRDQPALRQRGVLVDLAAYGRIPSIPTFVAFIKLLSRLKINQVHLYIRLSVSPAWQLLYTVGELITLDRHCRDRGLQLVPALDILQPCSLADLDQYYPVFSSLLPCFSTATCIHLGPCLSSVIFNGVKSAGAQQAFRRIRSCLGLPGGSQDSCQLQLCSNTITNIVDILDQLPPSVELIDYGFQADYPFQDNGIKLARSGCSRLVCTGTSAWNCIIGRPYNFTHNILEGAESVSEGAGDGVLVANWTGAPAMTHLSTSLPAWTLAAGLAWNPGSPKDRSTLALVLSHHVFQARICTFYLHPTPLSPGWDGNGMGKKEKKAYKGEAGKN